jgi:hypothetical protein
MNPIVSGTMTSSDYVKKVTENIASSAPASFFNHDGPKIVNETLDFQQEVLGRLARNAEDMDMLVSC